MVEEQTINQSEVTNVVVTSELHSHLSYSQSTTIPCTLSALHLQRGHVGQLTGDCYTVEQATGELTCSRAPSFTMSFSIC